MKRSGPQRGSKLFLAATIVASLPITRPEAPCGPFGAAMERVVSHGGRQEAV